MISTLLTTCFCAVPPLDPWIGKGNSVAVPLMQAAIDELRTEILALAKQAVPDPRIKGLEEKLAQAIKEKMEATQKLNPLELQHQQMGQQLADLQRKIETLSAELKAKPATADERIRQVEAQFLEAQRLNEDQKRLIAEQQAKIVEVNRSKQKELEELMATIERLNKVLVRKDSQPAEAQTGREDYQPDFQELSQGTETLMSALTAAQLSLKQITQERDDLLERFAEFGPEYDRMLQIVNSSEVQLKAELQKIVNKLKEILASWAQIADRPEVPPLALSRSGSLHSESPSRIASRAGSIQQSSLQGFTFPEVASVISPEERSLAPMLPVDSSLRTKLKSIIEAITEALDCIAENGLVDTARSSLSRDIERLESQSRDLAAMREQLSTITNSRDDAVAEAERLKVQMQSSEVNLADMRGRLTAMTKVRDELLVEYQRLKAMIASTAKTAKIDSSCGCIVS